MEEYSSEEVYSLFLLCLETISDQRERRLIRFLLSKQRRSEYTLFSIEKQSYRLKKQREQASSSSSRIEKSSSLFLFLWSIYVIYTLSFSVLSTSSRGRLERVIANLVVVFSLLTYIEYTLLQQQQQSAYAVRYDFSNSLSTTREQRRRNSSEVVLQQTYSSFPSLFEAEFLSEFLIRR